MPCCLTKTLIRIGVVGTIVGAGTLLVAGPDRVGALLQQARSTVHTAIDGAIDDPVALRAQLRKLEGQYPEKIAEVRGDLAELREQRAQLERDLEVGARVVRLAEADLTDLGALIARAEQTRQTRDGYAVVRVRFDNRALDLDQAYARATNIRNLRDAYAARNGDTERDLGFLGEQEQRLSELLAQLETERAEFQSQIYQLDRQVDAIARNDRMIDMMERRQETIDKHSRYRVASLDQLRGRFADMRAQQEARLQTLAASTQSTSYEDRAKMELDRGADRSAIFDFTPSDRPSANPAGFGSGFDKGFGEVIEITPRDLGDDCDDADDCGSFEGTTARR